MSVKLFYKRKKIFWLIIPVIFVGTFAVLNVILGEKSSKEFTKKRNLQEDITISGSFDTSKFQTDEQWRATLTSDQYHILREKGTEIPFTGALLHEKRAGTYYGVGCDEALFRSEQKYDSGTGWPSFKEPINPDVLVLRDDSGIPGGKRIEVLDRCGGHLGHVFDDGPPPTGKRYCMNSLALYFVPDDKQ